jgi:D-alanine-D-alanine ligase-like ATP-grasp enzyme
MARTVLQGHSGEGIVVCSPEDETDLPRAPLYTQYIKKKEEYRLHVFEGTIITRQRKARKTAVADEDVNWKVRNVAGGFIFARNQEHAIPACVEQAALDSILAVGLDFGAVDIIYNAHSQQCYVLEINTACGLEGTTLTEYTNAILNRGTV